MQNKWRGYFCSSHHVSKGPLYVGSAAGEEIGSGYVTGTLLDLQVVGLDLVSGWIQKKDCAINISAREITSQKGAGYLFRILRGTVIDITLSWPSTSKTFISARIVQ
jgi:hypothetical protein